MLYQKTVGRYYPPQPVKGGKIKISSQRGGERSEFKNLFKQVQGNEGEKCHYSTRLATYGCGCQHNCNYCYARSLLSFRNFWDSSKPRIANIEKIKRKILQLPAGTILRLGGMTDCFQPCELQHRVTLNTIKALNEAGIGYLIVTKSHLVAEPEYLEILNPNLAHIQISITSLDDNLAYSYEKASASTKRILAIQKLQNSGFDISIRLSPLIEEFMDFHKLDGYKIEKAVVEFLRINS